MPTIPRLRHYSPRHAAPFDELDGSPLFASPCGYAGDYHLTILPDYVTCPTCIQAVNR